MVYGHRDSSCDAFGPILLRWPWPGSRVWLLLWVVLAAGAEEKGCAVIETIAGVVLLGIVVFIGFILMNIGMKLGMKAGQWLIRPRKEKDDSRARN